MSAQERAALGALLMDEQTPDWFEIVDLATLQMADCDRCILGQVHGEYIWGSELLGLTMEGQIELGFTDRRWGGSDYYLLDEAWTREIVRRRLWAAEKRAAQELRRIERDDYDQPCGCDDAKAAES
jgi:hypothetical protein